MDYNWLENTPSVSGDYKGALPIWQPDYSFLQSMDMRVNQQYEQGFSKIANSYNSLFNQPVTGTDATRTQQDMAKDAQAQMKSISEADLSDPKNVVVAENILAPFWQNTDLLTNISKTKQISTNLQKAYSVRDSTDEKIRDQYDDRYVQLLQYQQRNLATAPLSDNKNVEIDDWTPFQKVTNHLDKQKDDDKFGVTQSFITGDGRIVTSTNGATSIPAFRTYADSKMDSSFDAQYNLLGKLSRERQIANIMQVEPGITRQQALQKVGAEIYPQIVQSMTERQKDYGDLIGINQAQLNKIQEEVNKQPGKLPTATQQYNIDRLNKENEQYSNGSSQLEMQIKSIKSDDGKKSMINHPEYYLGQQHRNDDVNKWALAEAGKSTVKYDTDQAFWSNATLKKDYYDISQRTRHEQVMEGIDAQKLAIEGYDSETKRMEAQGKYPWMFGRDGKLLPAGQVGGWAYGGDATTQNQNINPVDYTNLLKDQLRVKAVTGVWDPTGMASILSNIPETVATPAEILSFTREMSKSLTGQDRSKLPDDVNAYNKMAGFLHDHTGMPTGKPEEVNAAMMAYTNKYIDDTTLNGGMGKDQRERLRATYIDVKKNIDAYQKNEQQQQANVNKIVGTPEEAKKYPNAIVNGKLLDEHKMVQGAPASFNLIDATGQPTQIPADKIANAILHGDVSYYGEESGTLKVNGVEYTFGPGKRVSAFHWQRNPDAVAFENTFAKYLGSGGWKGTNKGISQEVYNLANASLKNTDLYPNGIGKIGPQNVIDHSNPEAPLSKALAEDVLPGQFNAMYDRSAGSNSKELGQGEMSAVQEMLNDPKVSDYIGKTHMFYPRSFTGRPGIEINVRSFGNEKDVPDNIKALSGKKIFIEQSSTHGATYNTMYPSAPDYSSDPLTKEGNVEKSDPTLNTLNHCEYQLVTSQGKVTAVTTIHTIDPKTGADAVTKRWIPLPLGEEDPDKIRQVLRDKTAQYGRAYDANLEYYNHHQHQAKVQPQPQH